MKQMLFKKYPKMTVHPKTKHPYSEEFPSPGYVPGGLEDRDHELVPYPDERLGDIHMVHGIAIPVDAGKDRITVSLPPPYRTNESFKILDDVYRKYGEKIWIDLIHFMFLNIYRSGDPNTQLEKSVQRRKAVRGRDVDVQIQIL